MNPNWKQIVREHLAALRLPPEREIEIVEELALHMETAYEDALAEDLSEAEAASRAVQGYDWRLLECELSRAERPLAARATQTPLKLIEGKGGMRMESFLQDLLFGVRMLRKGKMFTLVAIVSIALGIGANTAIFSLINAMMLRALPVRNPQELAIFSSVREKGPGYNFSYPLYERFRDRNRSFSGVIAGTNIMSARLIVNESGAVESTREQSVTGNFFSMLGVGAVVGRIFTEADDNPAPAQPAAVISYEFWKRRFGLDPGVVGRKISINNTPLVIVGVAPLGFSGIEVGARPDLWRPIRASDDTNELNSRFSGWLRVMGRLRPGASVAQAQAEIELIIRQYLGEISFQSPREDATRWWGNGFRLERGGDGYTLRNQFREPLLILMTTVAMVLLIACVNVANLLMARAATRRKEISVRLAVGASRFRLIRQLLTESLLLAMIGGAAGLFFARLCASALLAYLPEQTRGALDVAPDARVLGFTLGISVLTGLLFGLAPAWQSTRVDLTASLKDQSGASASRSRLAFNKLLVVAQVALSFFLLIGAGLFVRSLRNLRSLDIGFDYENIVQFSIDPGAGYNLAQRVNLYRQILSRLESLPGARSATLSIFSLIGPSGISVDVTIPGDVRRAEDNPPCQVLIVGPRFFETMKMPILAGREFGPQDERPSPPGDQSQSNPRPLRAVINQKMARYFFGDENPVGKRFIHIGQEIEIIGVAKGAKYATLREPAPHTFYLYYFGRPTQSDMTFHLRTIGDPTDYVGTIQRLVREIDPQSQVIDLRTMRDVVDESLMHERFIAQIAGSFSLFALLLACVGLYGVMSYAVTRRTNEIGIRMALGATAQDVTRLVIREVTLLVALGVGIGMAAAIATTRFVSAMLFGLEPTDPLTLTLATLLMIGVAALAGYLPARRAARVDPMVALRHE
ncbi:MAG: ABC transporter permease [Chloracidobacterium sp.]|nr:ABC transporter permease [Chloracidobacterium sp.]